MGSAAQAVVMKILQEEIPVAKDERQEMVKLAITGVVEKVLIPKMLQVDSLFNHLYKHTFYMGSYYDGLRITDAREFDLDLGQRLPLPEKYVQVARDVRPGFAKVYLTRDPGAFLPADLADVYKAKMLEECGESDRNCFGRRFLVSPEKMRRWFQGVLWKALDTLKDPRIQLTESGPAFTLVINTSEQDCKKNVVEIDLVPVLQLSTNLLSKKNVPIDTLTLTQKRRIKKTTNTKNKGQFLLVPKKPDRSQPQLFGIDFPEFERDLLLDRGCAKPVIKLMKKFRDVNPIIQSLSSYALKTVVMRFVYFNPLEEWRDENTASLFLKALKRLYRYLRRGRVPYHFDHRCNLLQHYSREETHQMADWLQKERMKLGQAKKNNDLQLKAWLSAFS